jgi:hypothetical protein
MHEWLPERIMSLSSHSIGERGRLAAGDTYFLLINFFFCEKDIGWEGGMLMLDTNAPFEGLDHAGRRRLWLLQQLIQQVKPDEALKLAERMEEFVLGAERRVVAERGAITVVKGSSPDDPGPRTLPLREAAKPAPVHDGAAAPSPRRGARLLEGERMREFLAALGAGADNTELARRFGLTPRQANGLRMGIEKQHPHLRLVRSTKPKVVGLDRPTELQMQEEFLRQKPSATTTLDDVVRFLRQRGDVVVRANEKYLVNGRLTMSASELVARANEKRAQLRQPAFSAEQWTVSPVANGRPAVVNTDHGAPRDHEPSDPEDATETITREAS